MNSKEPSNVFLNFCKNRPTETYSSFKSQFSSSPSRKAFQFDSSKKETLDEKFVELRERFREKQERPKDDIYEIENFIKQSHQKQEKTKSIVTEMDELVVEEVKYGESCGRMSVNCPPHLPEVQFDNMVENDDIEDLDSDDYEWKDVNDFNNEGDEDFSSEDISALLNDDEADENKRVFLEDTYKPLRSEDVSHVSVKVIGPNIGKDEIIPPV
eukprot:TRINITY_DN166571_c0_g1_i1.p1 TRINITY_DN166571_c0_g1~~TRINITY_DN166571_c0_g1_i1.p1  ORF type:complete len:213 (+),score=62.17 TRINITY_DN166571_c0_g1_i1:33-671(+)